MHVKGVPVQIIEIGGNAGGQKNKLDGRPSNELPRCLPGESNDCLNHENGEYDKADDLLPGLPSLPCVVASGNYDECEALRETQSSQIYHRSATGELALASLQATEQVSGVHTQRSACGRFMESCELFGKVRSASVW
jgi:hypothetical protein